MSEAAKSKQDHYKPCSPPEPFYAKPEDRFLSKNDGQDRAKNSNDQTVIGDLVEKLCKKMAVALSLEKFQTINQFLKSGRKYVHSKLFEILKKAIGILFESHVISLLLLSFLIAINCILVGGVPHRIIGLYIFCVSTSGMLFALISPFKILRQCVLNLSHGYGAISILSVIAFYVFEPTGDEDLSFFLVGVQIWCLFSVIFHIFCAISNALRSERCLTS